MPQTIERLESVSTENLERLSTPHGSLCVSIYIPTHRCGNDVQQDPIRLKNAVSEAKRQLVEFGTEEGDADKLLKPVAELVELDASDDFWQHQSDGLALLLNADEATLFQLPTKFHEEVSVSDRFYVKPLIRTVNADEEFHLVTVSRGEVSVFRGNKSSLTSEKFSDLPDGIEAVTSSDQQRGHNRHSFKIRANSGDSSVSHGHLDTKEEADLKQYFREMKDAIGDHLRDQGGPVLFAGVDDLFPYFKEEFDCCTVMDEAVTGNVDDLSDDELHDKAWLLVKRWHDDQKASVIDRFTEANGTDFGSTDLKTILQAAFEGRIETLLLSAKARNYGAADENGMVTRNDEEPSAATSDLYDLAAIRTLRADGRVVFVDDSEQVDSPIAAIFRYVA